MNLTRSLPLVLLLGLAPSACKKGGGGGGGCPDLPSYRMTSPDGATGSVSVVTDGSHLIVEAVTDLSAAKIRHLRVVVHAHGRTSAPFAIDGDGMALPLAELGLKPHDALAIEVTADADASRLSTGLTPMFVTDETNDATDTGGGGGGGNCY